MVQVYADDRLIYDPNLEGYELLELKATTSLEKAGTAEIKMSQDHPAYSLFTSFRSVVTIYRAGELLFRGRSLYPTDDFLNNRTITCEGERCFLRDSVLQPFLYQDDPETIFRDIISHHNAQVDEFKRFQVGKVTVTDPNDYIRLESESAKQISDVIDNLVERCGGYIVFTGDAGTRIINWYESLDQQSTQTIEFGENLLDYSLTGANSDPATVIYPYGAADETTGERVTIESVNDGVPYLMADDAIAIRGRIAQPVFWDDVTLPKNLLKKARKYLETSKLLITTLELSAVDLSTMDRSIDSFRVGDQVQVRSKPHRVDDVFLLTERAYDLLNPSQDTVTLGKSLATLTGADLAGDKNSLAQLQRMRQNLKTDYEHQINSAEENLKADYERQIAEMREAVAGDYEAQLDAARAELTADYTRKISAMEGDLTEAYESELANAKESMRQDMDTAIANAADDLRDDFDVLVSEMETSVRADLDTKIASSEAALREDYESQIADSEAALREDYESQISASETTLRQDFKNQIATAKDTIEADYEAAINDMKTSIEQDFTSDLQTVEQTLRDDYGGLVAGILDGSTPAGGVKTVSATVDESGYHLTSEGSVDFQTDDFNIKNAAGHNLMRVTAENTSTGEPGGQIELGEDGYPVRFASSFVLPPENGGTGYNHGQTHRITSEPMDSFGEDGDLAVFYNGFSGAYDDITPTAGAASTGARFGLSRTWNNSAASGYGQAGNSASTLYGLWWSFKTPSDIKLSAVTLCVEIGKYIDGVWRGWNVSIPLTVGLYKSTSSTTPLASTTFTPTRELGEQAVTLSPTSSLSANTTYYIAMYDAVSKYNKSLAQVKLASVVIPGAYGGITSGLFLKSFGAWVNLFKAQQVIQSGSVSVTSTGTTVTFDTPFTETPHITATYATEGVTFNGESGVLKIYNKTTSGFSIQIAGSYDSQDVDWIAVGK